MGLFVAHVGRARGPQALVALLAELEQRDIGEVCTIGPKHLLLILPFGSHGVFVPAPANFGSHGGSDVDNATRAAAEAPTGGGGHTPTRSSCNSVVAPATNASLDEFEVSLIRAAELYLWPIHQAYERQLLGDENLGSSVNNAGGAIAGVRREWWQVLDLTAEERAKEAELAAGFSRAQAAVCEQLGLSKGEWFRLAQQLWQQWEAATVAATEQSDDGDEDG